MATRELIQLLTRSKPPRALVVGDLMLDRYIWGTTDRISPEAPVPVVCTTGEEERVGGAGNVCANLAAMGAKVSVVGVVGTDDPAQQIRSKLLDLGVSITRLVAAAGRATTLKTRIIAHNQHMLRVDKEESLPINAATESRVIEQVVKAVAKADVVLISDYAKGLLTPAVVKATINAGRKAGIPVVVDPKAHDFRLYAGATLVKPNLNEFRKALGEAGGAFVADGHLPDADEERRMATAARKLLKQIKLEALVITLGKAGMLLLQSGKKLKAFGTIEQEAYDVTGAGDTALSAIGYIMAVGGGLPEAIQIANVAGGAAVAKVGTAPVSRTEIVHRLEDLGRSVSTKTKTVEELVPLLNAHRSRKQKISFTNGCFDVLHVGHIGLLKYARRQGDLLVVGMNSDASVRTLKGEGRPILDQDERSQLLAALEGVDYIVVFDETSVLPLVKKVRPDILVKGSDYEKSEVVGQAFVESYGGKIRRAPLVKGVSTTNIVEKIKNREG